MPSPRPLDHPLAAGLLVTALVLFAYQRAPASPFQYDDESAVVDAAGRLRAEDLPAVWGGFPGGRPLTQTVIAFDAWRSGMGPDAAHDFHVTNLLLHLVAAGLVYRLALAFCGPSAALLAALLFALHPLQAQAAAYVINRSSLLAAIGTLGCVLSVLASREGSAAWLGAALLSWVLGLSGKETAAVAPALALLALGAARAARPARGDARAARALAAFLLAGAVLCLPAMRSAWTGPLDTAAYARAQLWALPNYLRLLLFPWPQSVTHGIPEVASLADPRALAGAAVLTALLGLLWRLRRNPVPALALAWGLVALLPESSLIPLDERMMEHRTYLALAGAALGLGALLPRLASGRGGALLVALLVLASLGRASSWAEMRVLWQEACRVDPGSPKAWINLGQSDARLGRLDGAGRWTLRALRARPGDPEALIGLGAFADQEGRVEEAARLWTLAGDHAYALSRLGSALQELGRPAEAEAAYRRSLALSAGRNLSALNALGTLAAERGDLEGARGMFLEALRRRPGYFEARLNLGSVLVNLGEVAAGLRELEAARDLSPEDPGVNHALGRLFQSLAEQAWAGRPRHPDSRYDLAAASTLPEAAGRLQAALQAFPGDPTVHHARELLDEASARWAQAEDAFRRVLAFPPTRDRLLNQSRGQRLADALRGLGSIALIHGRREEGLDLLARALQADPSDARLRAFLEANPPPSGEGPAPSAP